MPALIDVTPLVVTFCARVTPFAASVVPPLPVRLSPAPPPSVSTPVVLTLMLPVPASTLPVTASAPVSVSAKLPLPLLNALSVPIVLVPVRAAAPVELPVKVPAVIEPLSLIVPFGAVAFAIRVSVLAPALSVPGIDSDGAVSAKSPPLVTTPETLSASVSVRRSRR